MNTAIKRHITGMRKAETQGDVNINYHMAWGYLDALADSRIITAEEWSRLFYAMSNIREKMRNRVMNRAVYGKAWRKAE